MVRNGGEIALPFVPVICESCCCASTSSKYKQFRADVLRLEVACSAIVIFAGLAVGLLLSFAVHRAVAKLLFGVSSLNANIYAAAAAVLTFSAMAAVLIPAFRAARMDPALALRDE